jgi:Asp-tRNA(Asn)/Glu-tRNA(Gln) amidotransferase A subunit family amidase
MGSAKEEARQVRLGERSPLDLVEEALRRIDAVDGKVGAWVQLDRARALLTARQRYDGSRHGTAVGELIGIPVGIKDIIDVDGLPTRAGAPAFAHRTPKASATVVEKLRHEGAIVIGKTATTQFAYSDPAPTRNPWNLEHTPGGSSSGSAAAVAAGMAPVALGSQTVGSVLRPAAYCGVVGLKPTHGRVSTTGVVPLAWSLDHLGVFARCVEDAALVLSIIAGHDPSDPRSADVPPPGPAPATLDRPPKLRLLPGLWEERATPEVRAHLEDVSGVLSRQGAGVDEVESSFTIDDVTAINVPILRFEAAQHHRAMFARHSAEYAPGIRGLIEAGLETSEAAYESARARQPELREAISALLEGADALLLPVARSTAPEGLQSTGDPAFCAPASTSGLPSISLPSGIGAGGLPLAVQLVGRAFEEQALLGVASWVEARLRFEARPQL